MNKLTIIGIAGLARQGKSTLAAALVEQGWTEVTFAGPLKAGVCAMLKITPEELEGHKSKPLPWLGVTTRKVLQAVGTDAMRNRVSRDVWTVLAKREIDRLSREGVTKIVVSDVRFNDEAEMLLRRGAVIWRVTRHRQDRWERFHAWLLGHASERGIDRRLVDVEIENDGNVEDLKAVTTSLLDYTPLDGRIYCSDWSTEAGCVSMPPKGRK